MPKVAGTRRTGLAGPWPTRLMTAAVLVGSGGAGLAYSQDPTHAIDAVGRASGFEFKGLTLTGQKETSISSIVASAGLAPGASIFTIDGEDLRRRVEALPWVEHATVRKILPGTVQLSISEAAPFARWRSEEGIKLIGEDGTVLSDTVPPSALELPMVAGFGANARAKDAVALLDANPLYQIRTRAAVLVGERRWDLVLDTGATVMLPEEGASAALDRLAELEMAGPITMQPVIVDMRLADRTVIELDPKDANELYIAPEEENGFDEPADLLAAAIAESKRADDPLAAAIREAMQ
ncbi:cell division protein FtsQ/DivIB [Acuticoccus yangtzensis]|uniref:cell division protein FtsQ/DivIB n=1 Tax=Acuticoccus yangtzensis TaxID=1443441 RepID=UPI0009FA8D25|nr:cell division protein FtsQ/DivIB [Acuticoccus yangtzensis]